MQEPFDNLTMVLEIAVFTAVIYAVLRFLRETRGAGVVRGLSLILISVVIGFAILIQVLALERLAVVFQYLTNIALIALVIVFQPEIRRAIIRIGESPIFAAFFRSEVRILQRLLRGIARLSKDRVGALIAIERDGSLSDITASGVMLDAQLNSYLIESLFSKESPLHDGAVVVRDDRIVAAKCLLPLSENQEIDPRLGTRHRAAVGLSEESDALLIVVSEETGAVSVALGGRLEHDIRLDLLEQRIDETLRLHTRGRRREDRPSLIGRVLADPWRKLAAAAMAVCLWFFVDSRITEQRPLQVLLREADSQQTVVESNLDHVIDVRFPARDFTLLAFRDPVKESNDQPAEIVKVEIMLRGPRGDISKIGQNERFWFEPTQAQLGGNHVFEFTKENLRSARTGLEDLIVSMTPPRVRVALEKNATMSLTPRVEHVDVVAPQNAPDSFDGRIEAAGTRFLPDNVTLRGTRANLDRLAEALRNAEPVFVADMSSFSDDGTRANYQLRLSLATAWRGQQGAIVVEPRLPDVFLEVAPDFRDIQLVVDVVLDTKSAGLSPEGFEPVAPQRVVLKVAGTLEAELGAMNVDQLRTWARRNVRLLATVPEGTRIDNPAIVPGLQFLFLGEQQVQQYQRGVDYDVQMPAFSLELKKNS